MSPSRIRLGTASPATQATTPETIAQLEQIARRAACKKIDILLLPEAYIGGYPRGTTFGCQMGSRTKEGRDEYLRYFQNAVDLGDTVGEGGAGAGAAWVKRELPDTNPPSDTPDKPSPKRGDGTREELERIARETGVFIITGLIEKAGGSMYCSAVYIDPHRGIIGKRRKVMPTGTERLVWAQGSPSTLRAVTTTIRNIRINLAAAICWENYMPLLRQSLYAQNINLYLAPTADGRDTWLPLMRTIAIEGRCFVVTSNMCVRGESTSSTSSSSVLPTPPSTLPESDSAAVYFAESEPFATPTIQPASTSGIQPTANSGIQPNRRNSCVTEDGFEIALPSSSPSRARQQQARSAHRRRESVFDEDGNEIVLPCGKGSSSADASASAWRSKSPGLQCGAGAGAGAGSVSAAHGRKEAVTGNSSSSFVSRGGSAIVSPFGEVVAGPQWEDDEGLVYADVDFDDCIRGRLDLDTAGSYSRNDSFKFSVEGLDLSPLPY
ncbi:putative nitrilase [Podospora aff. communis PSN243]|uniref:Nitrilase n=1 Tax=Podospora aff. communis PSN243 TaxID=3040156 RepID=A0AAV9GAB4_9PEZI|nr:putative nitrilase [Podospora aff. communis PSN243]